MGDYRVETKIRNGRILRALDSIGESPAGFAKKRGLGIRRMCAIVAMTQSPKRRDGMWHPEIMALADATNVMPSDFFTARQIEGFSKTKSTADISEAAVYAIAHDKEQRLLEATDPATSYAVKELADDLFRWLMKEKPRCALAVKMHTGDATYDEIAQSLGVTRERARQITFRGLRHMRDRARIKHGITECGA